MWPQCEVTNTDSHEAIRMLSQVVTNLVGQQRGSRQEGADTSKNPEIFEDESPKLH